MVRSNARRSILVASAGSPASHDSSSSTRTAVFSATSSSSACAPSPSSVCHSYCTALALFPGASRPPRPLPRGFPPLVPATCRRSATASPACRSDADRARSCLSASPAPEPQAMLHR
eukprot:5490151-Pleurochrysis_carterae.AAC.1